MEPVDDGRIREILILFEAFATKNRETFHFGQTAQVSQQSRFPNTCFAGDQNHLSLGLLRAMQQGVQPADFLRSSNQLLVIL
jgi:hypothetical protein